MIRRIAYASCYVYSPTGSSEVCEHSRQLRALLKAGDAQFMLKYAVRVHRQTQESPLWVGFFGATDVLVPVPGSAPRSAGGVWVADDLAVALVKEGLGRVAWRGLQRVRAVHKSATAAPGTRPSVQRHYESFAVAEPTAGQPAAGHPPAERPLVPPERIVLIDDVVTKGRTLLAAATRLHEAFPRAQIRAFALVRTMGLTAGVERLLEPCRGEIRWSRGDARRSP